MSDKSSKMIFRVLWIVFAVAAIGILVYGSKSSFDKKAKKNLEQISVSKKMEFESGPSGQIPLALLMAKSPIIVQYMQNPTDPELTEMALKEFTVFQDSFLGKTSFWVNDIDHKFYSDLKYAYTVDVNSPDAYWYPMTINASEDYNFNINYNPDLQSSMLWVNAVVRNDRNKGIGIAGTGIPLDNFIDSMYRGLDKELDLYLYNSEYEVTAATDKKLLEDKAIISDVLPGLGKGNIPASGTSFVKKNNGVYYFTPIESVGWMMVIYSPYGIKQFFSNVASSLIIIFVIAFILVAVQFMMQIFAPLLMLKNSIDEIGSGHADLSKRIEMRDVTTFSTISDLCKSFNCFIEKLQGIISNVKISKDTLVEMGDNLKVSYNETSSAITEIISDIGRMGEDIECQAKEVDSTVNSVNVITQNIENLDMLVDEQTKSLHSATSAIVEMIQNISSVNSSVENLSKKFTDLESDAAKGAQVQDEMNGKIQEILQQSATLQEANMAISNIAEQTNLLAMNAAIEAAHAGEAGKGFSVVADEIRKLSETSAAQSNTISSQLVTIQESIQNMVHVTKDSSLAFDNVSGGIKETNQIVQQIAGAMMEQEEGSKVINESLSLVNDSTAKVNSSSSKMSKENMAVVEGMKSLQAVTVRMGDKMEQMAKGADRINQVESVLDRITDEMGASIKQIGIQIDEFNT